MNLYILYIENILLIKKYRRKSKKEDKKEKCLAGILKKFIKNAYLSSWKVEDKKKIFHREEASLLN